MGKLQAENEHGLAEDLKSRNGALELWLAHALAGEDLGRSIMSILSEWNYTPVNANGDNVIVTGDVTYWGFIVVAAPGTVNVDAWDGETSAAGTRIQDLKSTVAVGKYPALDGSAGIKCSLGLVVKTSADPTDGTILAIWR